MPGSYDGEDEESQYTYKIDKDVEEVQAFYEPEMARLGWDLWAIGEAENGGGIFFYSKDGINASITISDLSVLGLDYTLVILIY